MTEEPAASTPAWARTDGPMTNWEGRGTVFIFWAKLINSNTFLCYLPISSPSVICPFQDANNLYVWSYLFLQSVGFHVC